MEKLLILMILVCGCYQANAQSKSTPFRLNGTINADTGTVLLLPIGGDAYNPDTKINYTAKIKNGRFTIEGKASYPCSFMVGFFPAYVSSPFMLEAGTQSITCNVDSIREIPKVTNKSTQQLSNVLNLKNAHLLAYVQQHPNSYVALWEVVRRMSNGYESVLDSMYIAFSPALKNTYTGKVFGQRLASSKATAIGQIFPSLNLLDLKNNPVVVPASQRSRYTLVDFWFSRCAPCLAEFPKLKELFITYKSNGFDIVGISIDKQTDIETWKRTIKERELSWNQYIDLSGKLTVNALSINLFPSNFLLDAKGTIVKKNISPVELSKFLTENLKNN